MKRKYRGTAYATWGEYTRATEAEAERDKAKGLILRSVVDLEAEQAKNLRCSCCKAPFNEISPDWRFNGHSWEHKCPGNIPQAGHFEAEEVE